MFSWEKLQRYAPKWSLKRDLLIVVSQVFFKERKGMMKRRTKPRKSLLRSHSQPTLNKLMAIEEDIITSHINELSHEEAIAVAKIKEDPNFFF